MYPITVIRESLLAEDKMKFWKIDVFPGLSESTYRFVQSFFLFPIAYFLTLQIISLFRGVSIEDLSGQGFATSMTGAFCLSGFVATNYWRKRKTADRERSKAMLLIHIIAISIALCVMAVFIAYQTFDSGSFRFSNPIDFLVGIWVMAWVRSMHLKL